MNLPLVLRAPTSVWLLRVVVVAGPMVALYAAAPEGFTPSPLMALVVLALSIGFALRPEHFVGTVALAMVLVWWALVVNSAFPDGTLLAAAALLAAHVAALLLGYGPSQMPVGSDLVRLWLPRGAAVWLAALVVWLTARVYAGHGTPGVFWLVGLTAALVGALVAAVLVPTRDIQGER
jgi:hypothetical protein